MALTDDEDERLEKLNVLLKMFDVEAVACYDPRDLDGHRFRFSLFFYNSRCYYTRTIDQLEERARSFLVAK